MKDQFIALVKEHKEAVDASFTEPQTEVLVSITDAIIKALKSGNKLLLCGNGGSAADAQHIAAEFIARYKLERQSLPAISLTTDTSIITATGNDYDFKKIFSRQVEGLGSKGDILLGISTSGNSENVLYAVEAAKQKGMTTIALTGKSGGKLKGAVDICFCAQTSDTPHIQEIHITALHAISDIAEKALAK